MPDILSVNNDFSALSIRDLLEAREAYHAFLIHKPNVVATAVGRYRIRSSELGANLQKVAGKSARTASAIPAKTPRTLENSEITDNSWPCVLVFVEQWKGIEDLKDSDDFIPKTLYMPDGRRIPVCVIEAPQKKSTQPTPADYVYPTDYIGGGYPVFTTVQGKERIATLGCLVSDGHYTYALTNRHVAGEVGDTLYTVLMGKKTQIGHTSEKLISKAPFDQVYPGWPGKHTFINMDVGLIKLEDVRRWTANVFGVGKIGRLADLSINNMNLRLIGCPVIASGASSGVSHGEIQALFYRFKSVGGFEYVADFLIGARHGSKEPLETHHGDSGKLWLLDEPEKRPIALQWGGHTLGTDSGTPFNFAMATSLSTVCRQLDVDLIRDWNDDVPEFWGASGHFTVAGSAIELIQNGNLRQFFEANREKITLPQKALGKRLSTDEFVPLADVPDIVWKSKTKASRFPTENKNHFADMDQDWNGETLLDVCKDKKKIDPLVWQMYYQDVGDTGHGALPFRVWQIFDLMTDYVRRRKLTEFLCAAGILSHFVGDACQPLHISYLHDGDPNDLGSKMRKGKRLPRAAGVHTAYETDMLDDNMVEFLANLNPVVRNRSESLAKDPSQLTRVGNGYDAACEIVELMQRTFKTLPPQAILDVFNNEPDALWVNLGDRTVQVVLDGCTSLATLWESAWEAGGGNSIPIASLTEVADADLMRLYRSKKFLPTYSLKDYPNILEGYPELLR